MENEEKRMLGDYEVRQSIHTVSYTHLDVYKRQTVCRVWEC